MKNDQDKLKDGRNNLDPYAIDKLAKIPAGVKVGFLKFWAAGATYYFIAIPVGPYLKDDLDLIVILCLVLGLVIEYIVNNIIRWMNNDKQKTLQYCFYEKKSLASLFINILYATFMVILIYLTYFLISLIFTKLNIDLIQGVGFGAEPTIFGILFFLYDLVVIKIKGKFKRK